MRGAAEDSGDTSYEFLRGADADDGDNGSGSCPGDPAFGPDWPVVGETEGIDSILRWEPWHCRRSAGLRRRGGVRHLPRGPRASAIPLQGCGDANGPGIRNWPGWHRLLARHCQWIQHRSVPLVGRGPGWLGGTGGNGGSANRVRQGQIRKVRILTLRS